MISLKGMTWRCPIITSLAHGFEKTGSTWRLPSFIPIKTICWLQSYDPRVNLSYQQNIGKATGYGFELETNLYLNKDITFFVNPTYTVLTYDDNLTYQGKTMNTQGNQVVDVPTWLDKNRSDLQIRWIWNRSYDPVSDWPIRWCRTQGKNRRLFWLPI